MPEEILPSEPAAKAGPENASDPDDAARIAELRSEIESINDSERGGAGLKVRDKRSGSIPPETGKDDIVAGKEKEIRSAEKRIRIKELKEEISAINERERHPEEGYKAEDGHDLTEKSVSEKEEEIRKLEDELRSLDGPANDESKSSVTLADSKEPESGKPEAAVPAKEHTEAESVARIEAALANGKSVEVGILGESGEKETGWRIIGANSENGIVTVRNVDRKTGKESVRKVPYVQLEEWNGDFLSGFPIPEAAISVGLAEKAKEKEEGEKPDGSKESGEGSGLEDLNAKLETARAAYAAKYNEIDSKFGLIRRTLNRLKMKPGELTKETLEYHEYQEALKAVNDRRMSSIRQGWKMSRIAGDMTLDQEIRSFLIDARIGEAEKLYAARSDAENRATAEDRKDRKLRLSEKIADWSLASVKWYRNWPDAAKKTFSYTMMAAGLGISASGIAAPPAYLGIKAVKGAFGGLLFGVGLAEAQKNFRRASDRKKAARLTEADMKGFDLKSDPELFFETVASIVRTESARADAKLRRETRKADNRKIIGTVGGVCIGALALGSVAHAFGINAEKAGTLDIGTGHHGTSPELASSHSASHIATGKPNEITDYKWQEGIRDFDKSRLDEVPKPGPGADRIYEELVKNDAEKPWNAGSTAVDHSVGGGTRGVDIASAERIPQGVELKVSNSDLEKAISDRLVSQGLDGKAAQTAAHEMFERFAKEHGLPKIHSMRGVTDIRLSPDGKSIEGMAGGKSLGWIGEDGQGMRRFYGVTAEQRSSIAPHLADQETGLPHPEAVDAPEGSYNKVFSRFIDSNQSGIKAIDERYGLSGFVENDIKEAQQLTVRMDALYAQHPEIPREDFSEMRTRLADIDNEIKGFPDQSNQARIGTLLEEKKNVESLLKVMENQRADIDEVRKLQEPILRRMMKGLREVMLGEDSRIRSFGQMKNIIASDFLKDKVMIGNGEKLTGIYQALRALPGGEAIEPRPGEHLDSWTRRVAIIMMRSHGIRFK